MQDQSYGILGGLAAVGALIGFGQLLLSDEKVTLRRAFGRAIVTAGLSVGAAAILIQIPGLPVVAVVGLGAAVASMGATGLERVLQRFLPAAKTEGDRP